MVCAFAIHSFGFLAKSHKGLLKCIELFMIIMILFEFSNHFPNVEFTENIPICCAVYLLPMQSRITESSFPRSRQFVIKLEKYDMLACGRCFFVVGKNRGIKVRMVQRTFQFNLNASKRKGSSAKLISRELSSVSSNGNKLLVTINK